MKPILAIDLGGTLISNKPADLAHYAWFKIMGILTGKPKIEKFAGTENYFKELYPIMQEFTGLDPKDSENKDILRRWIRSFFAFLTIGETKKLGKKILFQDFAKYLKELKSQYQLALITTQPQDSTLPVLSILGIKDLFDYIYESSFYEEPDKYLVFKRFISENGKPLFYIGNSMGDKEACEKLGIKLIVVTWDKQDLPVKYRKKGGGDYIVNNVEELKKVLEDPNSMPKIKQ